MSARLTTSSINAKSDEYTFAYGAKIKDSNDWAAILPLYDGIGERKTIFKIKKKQHHHNKCKNCRIWGIFFIHDHWFFHTYFSLIDRRHFFPRLHLNTIFRINKMTRKRKINWLTINTLNLNESDISSLNALSRNIPGAYKIRYPGKPPSPNQIAYGTNKAAHNTVAKSNDDLFSQLIFIFIIPMDVITSPFLAISIGRALF